MSTSENYSPLVQQKSIAVLPFADLNDNTGYGFLADGVQGDVLRALSTIADLKVISGTSLNCYAPAKPRNLPEIAEALGVAYVLEGSLREMRDKLRITGRLSDARKHSIIWEEGYDIHPAAV